MNMTELEKGLVNSGGHSRRVAARAARRLRDVPFEAGQLYLDVGCGNGAAGLGIAANLALDVTGIDLDPEQIRLATQAASNSPCTRFMVGDATDLPFEDGTFDIVATNKTTHHIPQWERALVDMFRVVTPGGYLIYGDFALPRWLALGTKRLPTRAGVDAFAEAHALRVVRRTVHGIIYDVVWQRPGRRCITPGAVASSAPPSESSIRAAW